MLSFYAILLRLGAALLLGAVIGAERELNAHSAGLRTMALVSLGSCLFQIIAIVGFNDFVALPHVQIDPSRIASYIVAGIGFLGAGSIFRSQNQSRARGLTTAATIWVVAAVGLACGCGLIGEAVASTLLTLGVLVGLRLLELVFSPRKSDNYCIFVVTAHAAGGNLISAIGEVCQRLQVNLESISVDHKHESDRIKVIAKSQDRAVWPHALDALRGLANVESVTMDLHEMLPEGRENGYGE